MSSRLTQSQTAQQRKQQADAVNAPSAPRSSATTSKMRKGNSQTTISSGAQGGGCRTEPPRSKPTFPAPSTITPSESISVRGTPSSSSFQTRTTNDNIKAFRNEPRPATRGNVGAKQPTSLHRPPVASRQYPSPASQSYSAETFDQEGPFFFDMPSGSTVKKSPASSVSAQQKSVGASPAPSTARASDYQLSSAVQGTGINPASRAMGGSSAGQSQHNYARDWSRDYSGGGALQQQPSGISIGVPQSAQGGNFHFHYNQVDNRKLTVHNNAPGHVTTTNNNVSNVDNSNHHNNNAPQGNTFTYHANNVGNAHTNVSQSVHQSAYSTGNSRRQDYLPPSESLPIRNQQYKREKHVRLGEWSGRTVTYETKPDNRPC